MTDPKPTKEQLQDQLEKVNPKVLGDLPEKAAGNLFTAAAEALADAAHNATGSQQESNTTAQSSTVEGVTTIYTIDSAADSTVPGKNPGHKKD